MMLSTTGDAFHGFGCAVSIPHVYICMYNVVQYLSAGINRFDARAVVDYRYVFQ
jgi:hypothetical protein